MFNWNWIYFFKKKGIFHSRIVKLLSLGKYMILLPYIFHHYAYYNDILCWKYKCSFKIYALMLVCWVLPYRECFTQTRNLEICLALMTSSWSSLECNTYCDTRHSFLKRQARLSFTRCRLFCTGTVTTKGEKYIHECVE